MNKEENNLCSKCKENEKTKYKHPCPYAIDIHDDDDDICYCCIDCVEQCRLDI